MRKKYFAIILAFVVLFCSCHREDEQPAGSSGAPPPRQVKKKIKVKRRPAGHPATSASAFNDDNILYFLRREGRGVISALDSRGDTILVFEDETVDSESFFEYTTDHY